MFTGSITALITPFKNGEVDLKAFHNFVDWQVSQGSHGVVPCGTTGEAPALMDDELQAVIETCVLAVNGRIPVIAGAGSNSTRKTIKYAQMAKNAGADAVLIVAPYYNKPSQEGLYAHFRAVNDSVAIPMVVYNIPGRSSVDIQPATMARILALPHVVGIKDATADLARPLWERMALHQHINKPICQLSGEDATATAFLAQGGQGCISVTSNYAPRLCAQMHEAWQNADITTMAKIRDMLAPLHQALFVETSPAPVKYAVSTMGVCTDEVRLPLVPASIQCQKSVDEAIEQLGLISEVGDGTVRAHG